MTNTTTSTGPAVLKTLGERWRGMSAADKAPWEERAKQAKAAGGGGGSGGYAASWITGVSAVVAYVCGACNGAGVTLERSPNGLLEERPCGVCMWLIIRKPTVSMPSLRAYSMC